MSQIYVNISPGTLYPIEATPFRVTEWGYDEGERKWLTHPETPRNAYPQRDQADSQYPKMFVRDVATRLDDSGLIEITAPYKGLISIPGGVVKPRLRPGGDTQMFSLQVLDSGKSRTLIAPVPKDVLTREYLTVQQPTRNGVGNNASGDFLQSTAGFAITVVPDPAADPLPKNYRTGWVLDARDWEDVANSVWLVRERYGFYYQINV